MARYTDDEITQIRRELRRYERRTRKHTRNLEPGMVPVLDVTLACLAVARPELAPDMARVAGGQIDGAPAATGPAPLTSCSTPR